MSQARFLKVLLAILALVICTGTLQATATLVVSPTTLPLTCDTLAGPTPGTVAVTLVAAGSESVVASSSTANVTVTSATSQTVASTSVPVNFTFSAKASCAGAAVGTTTGITLTFTPTPGTVITVPATLTVTNSGSALAPSTTAVNLTCNKTASPATGSSQIVNVYSSANLGTPFTVSNSSGNGDALPSWLTVSAGGTASGTPVALTFTAVGGSAGCGALPAGSTTFSSVHLTSTGSVAPDKLISVTVQVANAATLAASPTSVALTYVTGTTTYNSTTTSVSSTPAVFFTVNPATLPVWLNATPTSSNTSPQTLTFTVTAGAQTLAVGSYSANVHLAVSGDLDTVIPVTLQVNNPSATLSVVEGTTRSVNWTLNTPLPTLLITPISSDSPISYTVSTTAGTLSPQVSATQGLAYSFGSPIEVTFLQAIFGAAAPGAALSGAVIITPVEGGPPITVNITVNVKSPGAALASISPASLPTATSGTFTVVLTGSGFVASVSPTVVGVETSVTPPLIVVDPNIVANVVNSTSIVLTITAPSITDPYLPFSGNGGTVTLGVCNPASGTACSTPTATINLVIGVNPIVQAVTSASSFIESTAPALPTVAPYDILSIFGTNFCVSGGTGCTSPNPTTMYATTNPLTLGYPTSLTPDVAGAGQRNLSVTFYPHGNTTAPIASAPLLFATNGQINLLAPDALKNKIGSVVDIYVSFGYGTGATMLKSAAYPVAVTATDPGIFSVGGDGQGDAAALAASYALITQTAPAIARATQTNSDTILLYVSGLGEPDGTGAGFTYTCMTSAAYLTAVNTAAGTSLTSDDGLVVQPALVTSGDIEPCLASGNTDLPTVTIGGVSAPVTFAGWVDGAVAGLYQINAQLPSATASLTYAPASPVTTMGPTAALLPVVVTANSKTSQPTGVNLWVQQGLLAYVTGATSGPTSSAAASNPVYIVNATNGTALGTLTVVGDQGASSPTFTYANTVTTGTVNGLTLSALPSDLTLDSSAGTISGTPGSGDVGTTNVEITVTDSVSGLTGNVIISFVIS